MTLDIPGIETHPDPKRAPGRWRRVLSASATVVPLALLLLGYQQQRTAQQLQSDSTKATWISGRVLRLVNPDPRSDDDSATRSEIQRVVNDLRTRHPNCLRNVAALDRDGQPSQLDPKTANEISDAADDFAWWLQNDARQPTRDAMIALFIGTLGVFALMAQGIAVTRKLRRTEATLIAQTHALSQSNADAAQVAEELEEKNGLLAEASRRFQEMFQGIPVACYCYDEEGRIFEWNRACEALYDRTAADVLHRNIWETIVPREEEGRIRTLIPQVFSGRSFEGLEQRETLPDGRVRHILFNTFPLRGYDGVVRGAICANLDITARKEAEMQRENALGALEEQQRFIQSITKTTPNLLYLYDLSEQRNVYVNRDIAESLGYTTAQSEEMGSELLSMLVHPDDLNMVLIAHHRFAAMGDNEKSEIEYRIRHADGTWRWLHSREVVFNRREDGRPRQILGTAQDVTERRQAEELLAATNAQLKALATQDGLTGLKNHRAFQESLRHEWERTNRYEQPLSMLLIDVDNFKQYNDSFGHPAGDEVLREVARQIGMNARDTDMAARYGGEEFVILLPQTDRAGAIVCAERLRHAIEQFPWTDRAVTISIGVATRTPLHGAAADMVSAADAALYRSKHAGRNRVTHADDPISQSEAEAQASAA